MNPLLLSMLMSFAPGLLGSLFGDPQAKLRQKLMQLQNPGYQSGLINQFYQQALGSPAFSQGQGTILAGANAAQGDLARSLGARGLGTSGIGAIAPALIQSGIGGQLAGLRTQAYQGAQGQAQNSIQQQIAALTGTAGPSQGRQMFGVGLEAFQPFLQKFLQTKYPGYFGGGGQNDQLMQLLKLLGAGGGMGTGGSPTQFANPAGFGTGYRP